MSHGNSCGNSGLICIVLESFQKKKTSGLTGIPEYVVSTQGISFVTIESKVSFFVFDHHHDTST